MNGVPFYSRSWYIRNPTSLSMNNLGQNDGQRDNLTCTNALVVLNFGQPGNEGGPTYGGYGTYRFDGPRSFTSNAEIENAVLEYATGWYGSTGLCPRLKLVIGTNNYHQCPYGGVCNPTDAGTQWGNLVNNVQNWLNSTGRSGQIAAWAGSDMEQPSGADIWDCAGPTRQFTDAFNNNNPASAKFINYGTAWVPNPADGSCWSSADVYHVSYGAIWNWPVPETYFPLATDSWISVRAQYYMVFLGAMTTCRDSDSINSPTCTNPSGWFTPSGGWTDLWNKLNANQLGQSSLDYVTNIKFQ